MNLGNHSVSELFQQLGLPHEPAEIDTFVRLHRPLPGEMRLHEAPFWNEGQARFLRDTFVADNDWAEVVDQLNVMLHE